MKTPVPMSKWGKDHWSTLAYIECRVVDNHGYLDDQQMQPRGTKYPYRLRGYDPEKPETYIDGYGDWGALEDFVAAGLVVPGKDANPDSPTGRLFFRDIGVRHRTHQVALTEKGLMVAGRLRTHKARGGNFASFKAPRFETS